MGKSNCNKYAALALALLTILALAPGCMTQTQPEVVTSPTSNPIEREIGASAEIVPLRWMTLSFPNGGLNLALEVSEGDIVSMGDLLVSNYDGRLQAQAAQAQSALLRAQTAYDALKDSPSEIALATAEAALANAEANLDRLERSYAPDAQIEAAEKDLNTATLNLDKINAGPTQEDLDAAQADLDAAQLAYEGAQALLTLKAPFDGTITAIYIRDHEAIAAYQPVLLLADLSEFQVITTDLSEIDVPSLKVAQAVDIQVDSLPDIPLTGTIAAISQQSSGVSSVYYQVTVTLDEIPEGLRWGMTAYVTFPVD